MVLYVYFRSEQIDFVRLELRPAVGYSLNSVTFKDVI